VPLVFAGAVYGFGGPNYGAVTVGLLCATVVASVGEILALRFVLGGDESR
jgi:hypothetical protein